MILQETTFIVFSIIGFLSAGVFVAFLIIYFAFGDGNDKKEFDTIKSFLCVSLLVFILSVFVVYCNKSVLQSPEQQTDKIDY